MKYYQKIINVNIRSKRILPCRKSPWKCAVLSCTHYDDETNIFFYPISSSPLWKIWLKICGISGNVILSNLQICDKHFLLSDQTEENGNRKLLPNALPILDVESSSIDVKSPEMSDCIVKEAKLNLDLREKYKKLREELQELEIRINCDKCEEKKRKKDLLRKKIEGAKKKLREKGIDSKCLLNKVFSEAQIKYLMGKKVVWGEDDMAMAFTLRHMSNKDCYLYLKRVLNIPLPALSAVQKWAASK